MSDAAQTVWLADQAVLLFLLRAGQGFFFFLIYLFIYFWLCWVFVSVRGLSLVVASGGHSSSRCAGLSLLRPLLLRSTGSWRAGSVVVAHGPSCSVACGIFPDQGLNPCALHWQADSQPLGHQGSPQGFFFTPLHPVKFPHFLFTLHVNSLWFSGSSECFGQPESPAATSSLPGATGKRPPTQPTLMRPQGSVIKTCPRPASLWEDPFSCTVTLPTEWQQLNLLSWS